MRYNASVNGLWIRLVVVLLVQVLLSVPVLAQSEEELDDVTMQMVTDEDELSGEVMREIDLQAPVGLDSEEGDRENFDPGRDLSRELMDDADGMRNEFSEDIVPGGDSELVEDIGDVEDELIDEDGDLNVPIDDAIDDTIEDGGDLIDDTTDDLDDTTDDLDDTTDDLDDSLN